LVAKEELHEIVNSYVKERGYLTDGFVGDGSVRIGFVVDPKEEKDIVVGLRVVSNDPLLETEIVAVKVADSGKFVDKITEGTHSAKTVSANLCFLAMPTPFEADEKEVAAQMGVGLLEIKGKEINEIVPAKRMRSHFIELPKHKFEGLKLAQQLLKLTENDWGNLARVFCRAEDAYCGFNVGDVYVELEKIAVELEVRLSFGAGRVSKRGAYSFKFGEVAGFLVNGNDDKYTFVEKLGTMFVFKPSDWNFMLNLLSKVNRCHLIFYIGTARIVFVKHTGRPELDLEVSFVDGRDSQYEYKFSQVDLAKLTKKKK
jgi:hypothetical protein